MPGKLNKFPKILRNDASLSLMNLSCEVSSLKTLGGNNWRFFIMNVLCCYGKY